LKNSALKLNGFAFVPIVLFRFAPPLPVTLIGAASLLALWLFRVDIVGDLCQMAWEFFKHRHGLGSGFLKMRVKKRSKGSRPASFGLRTSDDGHK
jgi:hypothetical protein